MIVFNSVLLILFNLQLSHSNELFHRYSHNISVKAYHYVIDHWGNSKVGFQTCPSGIECEWFYSDNIKKLRDHLHLQTNLHNMDMNKTIYTIGVFNIHSIWERTKDTKPFVCDLRTNLTFGESEESRVRYLPLFDASFKYYDGYSSTHPSSNVQRVYEHAFMKSQDFIPIKNFSSLVKGASYVASDCHKRDTANANRDSFTYLIRMTGFRVDGLGRCMHTPTGPEGITLPRSRDSNYNLYLKRNVISQYLFNLAFENSLEPGYVTEKPFDALTSGTVPIYLGDHDHLKTLIPHPKSVIFLADFNNNVTALVDYLNYLSYNETAYEVHREWRQDYDLNRHIYDKPLLNSSWFCRICDWTAHHIESHRLEGRPLHHPYQCPTEGTTMIHSKQQPSVDHHHQNQSFAIPKNWNGKAIRGSGRQVFFISNGTLHAIPDLTTFYALKLNLMDIIVVDDHELGRYPEGKAVDRKEITEI